MKQEVVLFFTFIYNLFFFDVNAQKRNNIWLVGNQVGIDFNTTPPSTFKGTPLKAPFPQFSSSICDSSGKLLLYTDGENVWNNLNAKLEKKHNWWAWSGYTMPLLTVMPGNDSLYYLFGVSEDAHTLKAVTINANTFYGYGEIVYPAGTNNFNFYTSLLSNASIMVAGTSHCNQKDLWIVAHTTSSLCSYLVTKKGIDPNPVTTVFDPSNLPAGTYEKGNLKFSANGERMIMPLIGKNKVAVFDFNNLTGKFSHPLLLQMPGNFTMADAEISPDGTKLYFDVYYIDDESGAELHFIYQMDLNAGDVQSIQNSAAKISPYPDRSGCGRVCYYVHRSLQEGPDGKIYVSVQENTENAHIIENPDQPGSAATINLYKLTFTKALNCLNYNYIRSSVYTPKKFGIVVKKNNCSFQPVALSLLYKHVDSVKWDFGDAPSGNNNFSTSLSPTHLYPSPGSYNVSAIIFDRCFIDTAKTQVLVSKDEMVQLPSHLKDTVLCTGDEPFFDATAPLASSYLWSDDGSMNPRKKILYKGTYEVSARNNCSIDIKSFNVSYENCNCRIYVPSAFTPNNDGLNDLFKPSVQCIAKNYKFQIFGRLGNVVFSTSDSKKGWDGSIGAVGAENGTYVWLLQYYDASTKKTFRQKGTVILIK